MVDYQEVTPAVQLAVIIQGRHFALVSVNNVYSKASSKKGEGALSEPFY
jgi:hypothetical protein